LASLRGTWRLNLSHHGLCGVTLLCRPWRLYLSLCSCYGVLYLATLVWSLDLARSDLDLRTMRSGRDLSLWNGRLTAAGCR